jgi:hypothetical protein
MCFTQLAGVQIYTNPAAGQPPSPLQSVKQQHQGRDRVTAQVVAQGPPSSGAVSHTLHTATQGTSSCGTAAVQQLQQAGMDRKGSYGATAAAAGVVGTEMDSFSTAAAGSLNTPPLSNRPSRTSFGSQGARAAAAAAAAQLSARQQPPPAAGGTTAAATTVEVTIGAGGSVASTRRSSASTPTSAAVAALATVPIAATADTVAVSGGSSSAGQGTVLSHTENDGGALPGRRSLSQRVSMRLQQLFGSGSGSSH